jgi:hypothetical protein
VSQTVKDFQPGDEVFGVTGFAGGGLAEYGCAPEEKLVLKPVSSSFQEAAAIPIAGVTALQGLRDHGRIQPGQKVLVDGASGGVGTLAIQIAKSFGAEAAAVCSTDKMDTARSIGADHVIDYTREDFTKRAHGYDLILGSECPSFDVRLPPHAAWGRNVCCCRRRPAANFRVAVARPLPTTNWKKKGALLYRQYKPRESNFPERSR